MHSNTTSRNMDNTYEFHFNEIDGAVLERLLIRSIEVMIEREAVCLESSVAGEHANDQATINSNSALIDNLSEYTLENEKRISMIKKQ